MMQLPDNEKYSASDIERYYTGKMSPEERNALEKAALSDPFLADAIDGYAHTKSPGKDSIILKNLLDSRLRKKEKKPLLVKMPSWLKIAALVTIIAGCGWIIYKSVVPHNSSVASTQNKTTSKEPENKEGNSPPKIYNDSLVSQSNETSSPKPTPERKIAATKKQAGYESSNNNNLDSFERKGDLAKANNLQGYALQKKDTDNYLAERNRKSVQSSVNAPEAIALNKTYLDNKKDSNTLSMRSAGSIPEKKTKEIKSDTLNTADVVLKPIPDRLDEVIVSKTVRKQTNTGKKLLIIQDTLEPASGWTNFDNYIANNIKSPEELHIKPISGEVQLSFDIDKSGEPVNIKVDKSLCDKCDEEAIRLLKQGPKWKNKKSKKRSISIKF